MKNLGSPLPSHASTVAAPCAGRAEASVVAIRAYAGEEHLERKSPRQFQCGFKGACLVNGTISIDSQPMAGTTIHVRVPMESKQRSQRQAVQEIPMNLREHSLNHTYSRRDKEATRQACP